MKTKRKIFLSLATFASLFVLLIGTLNLALRFMDISPYHEEITHRIEEILKRKVTIGDARLSFINGLDLIIDNVTISEKNNKDSFISSERFIITFHILPLLSKNIAVKKIKIIHPFVNIYRARNGEINFKNWINEFIPDQVLSGFQNKKSLTPMMKKLVIKQGHFFFKDMQITGKPLITRISDLDVELGQSFSGSSVNGLISGTIRSEGNQARFKIKSEFRRLSGDIKFENLLIKGSLDVNSLKLKHFQPYFKQYSWGRLWNSTANISSSFGGSFARGFKSTGEADFKSLGVTNKPVLSDPGKVHSWEIDYDFFLSKEKLDVQRLKFKLDESVFTGKSLVKSPFSKNPFIDFEFQSTPFNVKSLFSNIPVSMTPIPLRALRNKVVSGNLTFESLQFKGSFNQLKNIHLIENFKRIKGEIKTNKVDFRIKTGKPLLKRVSGVFKFNKDRVVLSDISAAYKNSTISKLSGVIANPYKDPSIDLSARAILQLDQVLNMLPPDSAIAKNILEIHKIKNISGKAILNIKLSGNLNEPSGLKYSGSLDLKKASLQHDDLQQRLSLINGKIRFYKDSSLAPKQDKEVTRFLKSVESNGNNGILLYFDGLSGKYGNSDILSMKGGITGISTNPVFDLDINSELSLKEMLPFLASFKANKAKQEGILSHLNKIDISSGRSKLSVRLINLSSELNEWDFSGSLQLKNVSASHEKIPLPFSKLNGNILFTKTELNWKDFSGALGKSSFSLEGTATNYASNNPQFDVQLDTEAYLKEIVSILPFPDSKNYSVDGTSRLQLTLKGDYKSIESRGEFDLKQTSYKYKNWVDKRAGQAILINWEGVVENLSNFYFNKFEASVEGSKIVGDGTISGLTDPHLDIRVNATDFNLAVAGNLFSHLKNRITGGKMSTSFSLKGAVKGEKPLEFSGKAAIKEGVGKFDFSPNSIRNLSGKLNFNNQEIAIKRLSFSVGKANATIKGEITNFNEPTFFMRITSKNLDLNQFLPEKSTSIKDISSLLKKSHIFRSARGKIWIDAEKGRFKFLRFPHITGEIYLNNGSIIFKQMRIFLGKRYVSANSHLNFISDSGLDFSLKLHGKAFPAKKFENIFNQYFQESISGRLSLATHLMGRGSTIDEIIPSLSGNLSLLLTKGEYNKQNLISGIKQILGFHSELTESDLPLTGSKKFNFIKGSFAVKNGVAITENYIVQTPERKTSVVGALDLGNKYLDLSVGVAPWQKLNKRVSKIPVVGTILTGGDNKSLLVTYYNVKGDMAGPEVKAVPFKSLGKKVVSLFKGLYQAPRDIFAPSER